MGHRGILQSGRLRQGRRRDAADGGAAQCAVMWAAARRAAPLPQDRGCQACRSSPCSRAGRYDLIVPRRATPRADLLSALVSTKDEGMQINEEELFDMRGLKTPPMLFTRFTPEAAL